MAIQVGETLPSLNVYELKDNKPVPVSTESLFAEKKVVLFALPGAFTPTCSAAHLPGFVAQADTLKARGVDEIICLSVNDAWVMHAWGEQQNALGVIRMIGDGSADFTDAVDLMVDLTEKGMGVRSQRYAMIINDGQLEWLGIDAPGEFEQSSVEQVLAALD